jgi:hypothetical protein
MEITSGASSGATYDLALARKLQDSTQIEAQQALKLIVEAGSQPTSTPATTPSGNGNGRLHLIA